MFGILPLWLAFPGCRDRPAPTPPPHRARADAPTFDQELALRWAPIHYQDVDVTGAHGLNGRADHLARVDYDGDWDTLNNWEHLADDGYPTVAVSYTSVVETETHWFLLYAFFHPRDWTDVWPVGLDEHENDMEGSLMVIRRPSGGSADRFGTFLASFTNAHGHLACYISASDPTPPTPSCNAGLPLQSGGRFWRKSCGTVAEVPYLDRAFLHFRSYEGQPHPMTCQEAKGHGMRGIETPDFAFAGGDGVVYVPSLRDGRQPEKPDGSEVSYRLVDLFDPSAGLARAARGRPFTARPGVFGEDGSSFKGDCEQVWIGCPSNAANAPWAWGDGGEIATDPARFVEANFSGLGAFSHTYTFNPYRGVLRPEPAPDDDYDDDGYADAEDCDPEDPRVWPGVDADGDGFVRAGCRVDESKPEDCNDDPAWNGKECHPGAVESCDRLDNDCDGLVDEGSEGVVADRDGDLVPDCRDSDIDGDCLRNDDDPCPLDPGANYFCEGVDRTLCDDPCARQAGEGSLDVSEIIDGIVGHLPEDIPPACFDDGCPVDGPLWERLRTLRELGVITRDRPLHGSSGATFDGQLLHLPGALGDIEPAVRRQFVSERLDEVRASGRSRPSGGGGPEPTIEELRERLRKYAACAERYASACPDTDGARDCPTPR